MWVLQVAERPPECRSRSLEESLSFLCRGGDAVKKELYTEGFAGDVGPQVRV